MRKEFRPVSLVAAAAIALVLIIGSFVAAGCPFFFRGSLAEASTEIDAAEGKTWLDSKVVMEFRGSHSKEAILDSLQISPAVVVGEEDLKVEHVAALPWHEPFPWAKTRVTINPDKNEIFEPETSYSLSIRDETLEFETIILPRVTKTVPANWSENVSVHEDPIGIYFNEKIVWDDRYISVEPTQDVVVEVHQTKELIFVYPEEGLWENSTTYKLTVTKSLKDSFGHQMGEDFVYTFTTEPPVAVLEAIPSGNSQQPGSVVEVVFDRPPLPTAAEESFQVTPEIDGELSWQDATTLVWTPTKLNYSTDYVLAIGGEASWRDPIVPHEWQFRTQDPPVSVEIESKSESPTTLKAVASGGLGGYSYEWSTGETTQSISVEVPAGETWTVSVTATSGDQTASAEIVVESSPAPPAPPPATEPLGNDVGLSMDSGVVVRAAPTSESPQVGELNLGQEVKILGLVSGQTWVNRNQYVSPFGSFPDWIDQWYEIEFGNVQHGFVYTALVFIPLPGERSPFVSCGQKWVEANRANQVLHAYCDGVDIFQAPVGIGLPSTPTPLGEYNVWARIFNETMSGADYYVKNVLFTLYFTGSYGIHLDWWHGDHYFGNQPMSHGCIGLQLHNSQWVWFFGHEGMRVRIYE